VSWVNRILRSVSGDKSKEPVAKPVTTSIMTASVPADVASRKPGALLASFPKFQSTAGDQLSPKLSDRFGAARMKLRAAFTPSQPVVDRRMFAGRVDVLTTLIRSLEDQRVHVVLYGERGIGKTSLVHVLAQAARDARYIVIYSSCGATSNFDELFRAVAAEIPLLFHSGFAPTAAEAERGQSVADLLPAGEISPRQVSDVFAKIIGTRVLIVLDEFDVCESTEFRRNIAELIKNLSDRSVRVQLVIAGVAGDLSELVEHIPSIRRNIFAFQVPKMSTAEIHHLIENGQSISGVSFESPSVDFITSVANGSPYIACLLSHHAGLAAVDKGRLKIAVEDVAIAVDQALAEFQGRISRQSQIQIDKLTKNGVRQILGMLAGASMFNSGRFDAGDIDALYPSAANAANCREVIEELTAKGILIEAVEDEYGRAYRFQEEAVPPYLWILAAQKRFLDGQKPAKEEAPAASTARAAART
jgi:hypothetical protein